MDKIRFIKSLSQEESKGNESDCVYNSQIVPKEFIRNESGFKVYAVDGQFIRDNIETDFIGGGHHYVEYDSKNGKICYNWIPENEIWIEKSFSPKDREAFVKHEISEAVNMRDKGKNYSEAHGDATDKEMQFRDKIKYLYGA
jgi:hypothetical protein